MASALAKGKFLRISPRKVRLVAGLIRGKTVAEARSILAYTVKAGAPALAKILNSAVANAESAASERRERIRSDEMIVKDVQVGDGMTIKRRITGPRGRAMPVRKRTSHIRIHIGDA